jgi:hypothetical protein
MSILVVKTPLLRNKYRRTVQCDTFQAFVKVPLHATDWLHTPLQP